MDMGEGKRGERRRLHVEAPRHGRRRGSWGGGEGTWAMGHGRYCRCCTRAGHGPGVSALAPRRQDAAVSYVVRLSQHIVGGHGLRYRGRLAFFTPRCRASAGPFSMALFAAPRLPLYAACSRPSPRPLSLLPSLHPPYQPAPHARAPRPNSNTLLMPPPPPPWLP